MHLESALVGEIAERIGDARKLYGNDSPYVIGLITAFEWVAQGVEGGEDLKRNLLDQIVEGDGGKPTSRPGRDLGKAVGEPDRGSAEVASAPERGTLTENSWIKGIVKWFNNDKGYGFISTDSNVDVFVHWRDISSWDRSLAQGDEVEFMVTRTAKGFQAINVMKAGQEGAAEDGASTAGESQAAAQEMAVDPATADEGPAAEAAESVARPPSATEESPSEEGSDGGEGGF